MKNIIILMAVLLLGSNAHATEKKNEKSRKPANTYVHGYSKSNGTYVQPHYRTDSDHTTSNNWSTKGNINPYTGKAGTKTYPSEQNNDDENN